MIAKLNVKTGEVIYSEPLGIGDPKDVTLDKSGRLVLTTKSGAVHLFDAETLEHIGGKGLDCAPTTLTFNERLGGYYAIMGGQLFVIDSDFNMLGVGRNFSVADNYVAHAMSSDKEGNNYVLCVKGVGSDQYVGRIIKYDKDMKQVLLTVDFALPNNYEPTGLSIVDGEMYISGCSTQPVTTLYKITVKQ